MKLQQPDVIAERFFGSNDEPRTSLDAGFLADPDSLLGRIAGNKVTRLHEVLAHRCAVILGEPGIGKSTLMKHRRKQAAPAATFFDLAECTPEDVLSSSAIAAWIEGQKPLHLILDSLDLATNPPFLPRLLKRLESGTKETLRLEMTCRATEWLPRYREQLSRLFGESAITVVHLQPLRRIDAEAIARGKQIDASQFMEAITSRDLEPLASNPLTLELLIHLFSMQGKLPKNSSELYHQACLSLCAERDPARQLATDQDDRVKAAAVLAAITVLSRRWKIGDGPRLLEESHEIVIDRLVELIGPLGFPRRAILDTLATGLFVQIGPNHRGWYHQTLAEYLTARWLHERLSFEQLHQLLFHPADAEHLVPQLAGVAVWLAGSNPQVLELLARHAPEHFLRVDGSTPDKYRAIAVETLFAGLQQQSLSDYWWSADQLSRLAHAQLVVQLKPFIFDHNASPLVRRKALEILAAAGITGFQDDLCAIAENASIPAQVRAEAVEAALSSPGDNLATLARLRPLAEPGDSSDPAEGIRGAVLARIWPNAISSGDLFRLLTRPQRTNHFGGAYDLFIARLPSQLEREHLPDALNWVYRNAPTNGDHEYIGFERLAVAICRKAFEHIDDASILTALGKAVIARLATYGHVTTDPIDHNDVQNNLDELQRRALVSSIAAETSDPKKDAYNLLSPHGERPFLQESDVDWLLTKAQEAEESKRTFWEEAICWLVRSARTERTLEIVLEHVGDAETSPLLPMARFVRLGTPEAVDARRKHLEWSSQEAQYAARTQQRRERALHRGVDLKSALDRALNGDMDAWWQTVAHLFETNGDGERELKRLFGWHAISNARQTDIIRAATSYLTTRDAEPKKWLGNNIVFRPALAGYLSLRLALDTATEWLTAQSSELAQRWVPAVVAFDANLLHAQTERDAHRRLVEMVFREARSSALGVLRAQLRRTDTEPAVLGYLPQGDDVGAVIQWAMERSSTVRSHYEQLFEVYLRCARAPALRYAHAILLGSRKTKRRVSRMAIEQANAMLFVLFLDGNADSWPIAWNALALWPSDARAALKRLSERHHNDQWGLSLPDEALRDLYAWLEQELPITDSEDGFSLSENFRSSLLSRLAAKGAVDALSSLLSKFPSQARLKTLYFQARHRHREQSWQPVTPETLLSLAALATRRVIESDEHLLQFVVTTLGRYATYLHGETPAVIDLWNYDNGKGKKRKYWPKDENDFSDHVKRYLHGELDSMFVDREVEIRPSEGKRRGQRADLLVQALDTRNGRRFTIVLELKCCWNKDLEADLDGQLASRYLSRGTLRCGVYCVGWFNCADWTRLDHRRSVSMKRQRVAVSARLEEQAAKASVGGRVVRVVGIDATIENLQARAESM